MSAAEDDTELRDLLLQNLENSGVLHKLKAQMRAAVFLAMEEQDRIENKSPLVNENLKKCLNTKDGRTVAGLVLDFLQVYDLDFTRSVFEPETNAKSLESRELLCKDLGLDPNPKSPILLDLVQRRHKDRTKDQSRVQTKDRTTDKSGDLSKTQEPSEKQLQWVRKRFDCYDRDSCGSVKKDDVKKVFFDLFPQINRKVLEQFVLEELRGTDSAFGQSCDWSSFLALYRRLRCQCCAVVTTGAEEHDMEQRLSPELSQSSASEAKGDSGLKKDPKPGQDLNPGPQRDPDLQKDLDLDDIDDGDSFFDDPLPAPQKTYGWKKTESPVPSLSLDRSSSSGPRPGAPKDKGAKDRAQSDRSGSQRIDEDVEYDDDFNSHRSDLSRSEVSIGEEIEEVSIEGPEPSDQLDEMTQDLSVSQLSHNADYMEDVP